MKNDNGELYLKASIVPHGNHDEQKECSRTDSSCSLPAGMRLECYVTSVRKWMLAKIDF